MAFFHSLRGPNDRAGVDGSPGWGDPHSMEETNSGENPAARGQAGDRVRPLESIERRVLGVLIEKAKTTPDQYPLSLNALVTGCTGKKPRMALNGLFPQFARPQ